MRRFTFLTPLEGTGFIHIRPVGLFSTAACGLTSPTQFTRSHAVFKNADYTVRNCADLFPRPRLL